MKQYLKEIWKRKDLTLYLVASGLKAEHRNTALGYFWWLLDPLLGVIVYWFLRVVVIGMTGENVVVFLAIGLTVFRNFSATINGSAKSISGKAGIITQVYMPKAVFPLASVITQGIHFGFALIVIAGLLVVTGTIPGVEVFWLPFVILTQLLFHGAVALVMAYIAVFIRDIENVTSHLLRILRYSAPVIWEEARIPRSYSWIVDWNPFAWILQGYRNILMYRELPDFVRLSALSVVSLLLIFALLWFYSRNEHKIIKAL